MGGFVKKKRLKIGSIKKVVFLFAIFSLFFFANNTLALQTPWPNSPAGTPLNDNSTLPDLVRYLYEWLFALTGFFLFISLVYAGIQYMASMGNSSKMSDATGRITSSFLGVVFLLGSWLILNTINPELTSFKTTPLDFSRVPQTSVITSEFASTTAQTCDSVYVKLNSGTKTLERDVCLTGFNPFEGESIISTTGKISGDSGGTSCNGTILFYQNTGCGGETSTVAPIGSPDYNIGHTIRSMKFF